MSEERVRHNERARRFEMDVDGELAVAEYRRDGETMVFTHTAVPQESRGEGVGDRLARAALEHARDVGARVVPQCQFISSWMRRHPEYDDLRE